MSEAAQKRGPFATVYHVRAVVDHERSDRWGHLYQVVLRHWSARKGWRYQVECQFAFTPLGDKDSLPMYRTLAQQKGAVDG